MKAVRIKFHQDTAQFRNPLMNGKNRTTFPLPPYSTMIGMVHRLCKWDTTHTINVSVRYICSTYMGIGIKLRWIVYGEKMETTKI